MKFRISKLESDFFIYLAHIIIIMKEKMKIGDYVLISPDLTQQKDWIKGKIIEVENNSFVGIVVSAETSDGNVFFGVENSFKLAQ